MRTPLTLPIRVIKLDGLPKLIAGGMPVTPVNVVLARRKLHRGATAESLDAYTRAGRLYSEFCAQLERSIVDITNSEFYQFTDALLGKPFLNSAGESVRLNGERGKRTADLMLSLLYSLASDIAELYDVHFDWLRYRGLPGEIISTLRAAGDKYRHIQSPRTHHIKWTPRKVIGLPDDQFVQLIEAAHKRWGDVIADGDVAFSEDPESQRGALFIRNVAILFVLRFGGAAAAKSRSSISMMLTGQTPNSTS